MPFIAHTDQGEAIAPAQANPDSSYTCPSCESELRVRSSHERGETFVSRHFWHVSPSGSSVDCEGESDKHRRMKSIAMSKASNRWPDSIVSWESTVGDRRADVLVEFPEKHPRYGNGVAIECQHKNESKDIQVVESDFTDRGYSVLWLYDEQYSGKDVDLDAGEWIVWWANEVPDIEEWSGYHGIVHWLRQDLSPSVVMDIELPPEYLTYIRPVIKRAVRFSSPSDKWENPFSKQIRSGWGSKVAYISISISPSDNPYLVLSKGEGDSHERVNLPIQINKSNADEIRSFADKIGYLRQKYGGPRMVNQSAENWETECECWLDGWGENKGVLEMLWTPDGKVAISLKHIKNRSQCDSIIVGGNISASTIIFGLYSLTDWIEGDWSESNEKPAKPTDQGVYKFDCGELIFGERYEPPIDHVHKCPECNTAHDVSFLAFGDRPSKGVGEPP